MDNEIPNILIVDDDEITAQTTSKLLSKSGYHIDVAKNGMDAMEMLMNNAYHVVITDLSMPHVSGQQLISAIKRNMYADVKILVLSSFNNETMINNALQLGADDYIIKPFKAGDLLYRVQKLL